MFPRNVMLLILIFAAALCLSCARLDDMQDSGASAFAVEQLPQDGSVPGKYGDLVAVSSVEGYPDNLQLWFQDEKGDLRLVRFSVRRNQFMGAAQMIPRK
jgi:hypothetical protein